MEYESPNVEMRVVYTGQEPPHGYSKSIFLAGPTPRQPLVSAEEAKELDWKYEALRLLEQMGYDGVVYVPLWESDPFPYDVQVAWEVQNLNRADQIVFWVPRDMEKMPALTTNVEFGRYHDTGRVVLGFPPTAVSMRYLATRASASAVPICDTLEATLGTALNYLGQGRKRVGGERDIPLNTWRTPPFQEWLTSQKCVGNRLDGAEVLWSFRVGPQRQFTFASIVRVNVHIASEGRNKTNEFVFFRPDISTLVGYNRKDPVGETEIALIREFRSPVRNKSGFIWEVPGGSSWKPHTDPIETMLHEMEEETGLGPENGFTIEKERIRYLGSRQLCGTLSSHKAHVFACPLSEEEMQFLRNEEDSGHAHGVAADSEQTYVHVMTVQELFKAEEDSLDWSMVGMILNALL